MRVGLIALAGAVLALAWAGPASAELDALAFGLHEGERPQARWVNLADSPFVRPPTETQAQPNSSNRAIRLEAGETATLLLPGGSDLLLRNQRESTALADMSVMLSRDGSAWLEARPEERGQGRSVVPAPGTDAYLVRIQARGSDSVRFTAFRSRTVSVPTQRLYRYAITPEPDHRLRVGNRRTAVKEVAPGGKISLTLMGPTRLAVRHRRLDRQAPAELTEPYRLVMAIDGQRQRVYRGRARPERGAVARLDGRIASVSAAETAYLQVPAGEHTVRIEASARVLVRVLRRRDPHYLLTRPANWGIDPAGLYGDLGNLDPKPQVADSDSAPQLERALWARLRAPMGVDAGPGATAMLAARAEGTPFPDAVRRAALTVQSSHTSWRGIEPRDASQGAGSLAYARPTELRGPLVQPDDRPAMTAGEVASQAASLRSQSFQPLGGEAPSRLHYPLPERQAPSELRVYAAHGQWDGPVHLALHFDSGPTRRLRLTPEPIPAAPVPEAEPALAALRELGSGKAAAELPGTLGGAFSALGSSAPLVSATVATVPLPQGVRRVTVAHQSGPSLPVGLAYRAPRGFEMGEATYSHAVEALGGRVAARELFRTRLRQRAGNQEAADLDGPFAKALAAHWTGLVDFLAARRGEYGEGIHDRGHRFRKPETSGTRSAPPKLARQAKRYEDQEHWGAAAQAWARLAERPPDAATWRRAEMRRIRALREVGASGLADRLLRGFHRFSDDARLRDQAFQRLRQELGRAGEASGVLIGAHGAQALRSGNLGQLGPVVAMLLERDQQGLARDLAAVLPPEAVPARVRARAFQAGGWPQAAARARQSLAPAAAARFRTVAALRAGELAQARAILARHPANAAWADSLAQGRAIARALAAGAPPQTLSDWLGWLQDHPGPRLWAAAPRLVTRSAGTRTLQAIRRANRVTRVRATPAKPVRLQAPAGRLRLTFRLLLPPDARDQTGWVRMAAGEGTRQLPVTATGPAGGLAPLVGEGAVGPGNRYTVALDGSMGQVTLTPNRPMLVAVERRQPVLRLPVLPELWPDVLASRVAQGGQTESEGCLAEIDWGDPETDRIRRVCGTAAGLTSSLPRDSALPDDITLAASEDPAATLANRLAECRPPYDQCPAVGRRIYAQDLAQDDSDLLDRLRGMVGPYFGWERVEQVTASAGIRTVEVAGWQPHSPKLRARTPFLGQLDGHDQVLFGPGRMYFDFMNHAATTLVFELRTVDMPTYPPEPTRVEYRLDNGPWRSTEVAGDSRQVTVPVGPGRHTVELRIANPTQGRYLVVAAYEPRADGKAPLDNPLKRAVWDPVQTPVKRSYEVATRAEPAVFAVGGPALVRVDRYRADGIVSAYRRVPPDQNRARVAPEEGRSEALVRVYQLRHRGAVPESAPRYTLKRPSGPPERGLEAEAVPSPPVRPGQRPRHGQGAATTSAGVGYQMRAQPEDEPGGSSDRDGFLEWRLDRRWYDAVADRFYQGGLLVRTRSGGRPTLGGTARVLFPDRVLGGADGWPLDLTLRGRAFVQDTAAAGAESAWTARASARHRRRFGERSWLSGRLHAFARHLSLDSGLTGSATADRDVFTRYKADHPLGWGARVGYEYRPFLDTALYGRLGAQTNADGGITGPDHAYAEAGVRQMVGGLRSDLAYRETRYFADGDRADALRSPRLGLALGYDLWRPLGDRLEGTGRIRHDVRQSETSFALGLTWHFGAGQTLGSEELGNGRLLRDFRPDAEIFRSLREARAPGWETDP